jgi:hypothetical protein
MVKNVFLAFAAVLLLAAVMVPVSSSQAGPFKGCWKASQHAGLKTFKDRRAYRQACRAHNRAAKKAA